MPFCDTEWQARQFSFLGLPTLNTQRPFASKRFMSYTGFSGTRNRWSSGLSGDVSTSHAASRRSFMPSTAPMPLAAVAAPRQFSRSTWRAHSLES